jgi:hypothetical protein
VRQRSEEAESVCEEELIAATGISHRSLTRWRQQGLIPTIRGRHGRGPRGGRGTTGLRYPAVAVKIIHRIYELQKEYKGVEEWRWCLWIERYPVRIGPDLAGMLRQFKRLTSKIKTLDDIETKILPRLKPAYMPRGHPLRLIFRDLSEEDLRAMTTLVFCVVLGIKLPLFDEPDPYPFRVFKRAFGLPTKLQFPPGLFAVLPFLYEQICNALSTASPDELAGARAVCRMLSRIFNNPKNWRRGAIVIAGAPLPWRVIKMVSLFWPSPLVRAGTVGLVIVGMRLFKRTFGIDAAAVFVTSASTVSIELPE